MDGTVLLIIGLASLAVVLMAFAYCGLKAYRVVRHGMVVYGRITPLAERLNGWSIVVEMKAQRLAENGEAIADNLARLQESIARLQIVAQAFGQSVRPIRRVTRYVGLGL